MYLGEKIIGFIEGGLVDGKESFVSSKITCHEMIIFLTIISYHL